jgi:hypothetical protein
MPADFGGLLARAKAPAMKPMKDMEPMEPMPEVEGEEDGLLERMTPIATDLLAAVRGGDVDAIAEALIASHKAANAGPSEAASEYEE